MTKDNDMASAKLILLKGILQIILLWTFYFMLK